MSEREGFLASITLNIRAVMYEAGALQQVELESEVLRRLGLYEDTAKHATVKRRIYDALSTFIALEIIQKVNKMLYWNGFPHYGPKPDLPGSGNAEVQSKLDSSAIVTEDSSRTLNSETNEHDPVGAGVDDTVPATTEEGDDNASVEELEAQIAELERRLNMLSQQHAYYTFFNSQALLSPQWDQGAPPVPPPVALPFTVIAVPSEADAVIFSNQNHTRISIDASMQNITILSDDQIVQALIQNTDKGCIRCATEQGNHHQKKEKVKNEKMPEAVTTSTPCLGPYSPAVKAGNLVFVSGQLGIKDGELADGVQAQTRLCLENLKAVLEAAGTTMKNVVKCQVCLKNMDDFAKVNEVYAEFFTESKPARICVEVARLPKDALVEIDAIAEQ